MGELQGKVALITGASRGIGRAIAIEMAKEGASVAINYSKDDKGAEETLKMVNDIGGYALLIKKSVSTFQNCKEIFNEILEKFGKIDILINNAGISKMGLFIDSSCEDIDEILNVNLMGTINLSKIIVPYMIGKNYGRIVNISSMWGETGASCEVLYSMTKGAINSFTKALAKEIAMSNIRVNAIAPGVIDTKMNNVLDDESKEALIEEIPLGRLGKASEIAKVALFLCKEDSSYITGQIIRTDGGFI